MKTDIVQASFEEFDRWWRALRVDLMTAAQIVDALAAEGVVCLPGGMSPESTLRAELRGEWTVCAASSSSRNLKRFEIYLVSCILPPCRNNRF